MGPEFVLILAVARDIGHAPNHRVGVTIVTTQRHATILFTNVRELVHNVIVFLMTGMIRMLIITGWKFFFRRFLINWGISAKRSYHHRYNHFSKRFVSWLFQICWSRKKSIRGHSKMTSARGSRLLISDGDVIFRCPLMKMPDKIYVAWPRFIKKITLNVICVRSLPHETSQFCCERNLNQFVDQISPVARMKRITSTVEDISFSVSKISKNVQKLLYFIKELKIKLNCFFNFKVLLRRILKLFKSFHNELF